ncbi:MAG: TerB family tellurite resistance protein [Beijerinckiaceae bacterium]
MFDKLRRFLTEFSGAAAEREFREDDYRLAAVALLVHLAEADGIVDGPEKIRLKEIIERNFGLDDTATARLITTAERSDHEAVDFYHFTNVLKRALDENGRLEIIEMMWGIAFADGHVDELEENIVWRIAGLLGISSRDRIMLRRRVAAEPQSDVQPPGTWSKSDR